MTVVDTAGIEKVLRELRQSGRKLLVPYVTGGLGAEWLAVVEAVAAAGADAVEVGIPFSDPVMDGPIIQEASAQALVQGATPLGIVRALGTLSLPVPIAVMTYYNPVFRAGHETFARALADHGVGGAIIPDLPLEEVGEWAKAADGTGVATIMLAAPTTPDDALVAICERSRGWVYGVGLMGVTGERTGLAASAVAMGRRLKAATDRPVLIGVGVSNPAQAAEVAAAADGVIVGSALVRRLLEGQGPTGAARFVGELRKALDQSQ